MTQVSKRRKPARHAETNSATKQRVSAASPTLRGIANAQNPALAPSGRRKYPYAKPEGGTSIVKACRCHSQTKRITKTATIEGRTVFVRRNTAQLSHTAERLSATHHPSKTNGTVPHPCCSPMTIVTDVALSPRISGTIVERAICRVADLSGVVIRKISIGRPLSATTQNPLPTQIRVPACKFVEPSRARHPRHARPTLYMAQYI